MSLLNPGFEGGTCRDTFNGTVYSEIEVPASWVAFWQEGGDFYRPEMKVIHNVAPYLDPPRVVEGNQALQFFGFWKRINAGIFQHVTGLTPGATYIFSAEVHAWYSQRDDPHKSEWNDDGVWRQIQDGDDGMGFYLGVDPTGAQDPFLSSVVWAGPLFWYDEYMDVFVEFTAVYNAATLYIRATCDFPFKHCDAYVDDARLGLIEDPEPVACPGQPREDYQRRYHVWPTWATPQRIAEIKTLAGTDTSGPSYDDAMMGNLTDKTAYLYDIPLDRQPDFIAFRDTYYNNPPARIVFVDTPDPDPPDPPIDIVQVPRGVIVGWGTIGGQGQEDLFRDLAAVGATPPSAKFVQDLGAAAIVKQYAPQTKIIGRKIDVQYNGQQYNVEGFDYNGDPISQAEARMELLRATMQANPAVDYWEIVNEQKPPASSDIVKICLFFIRAMQIAEGWGKRLALFSFSTGTPEPVAWNFALYNSTVFAAALNGGHSISLHEYGLWPRDTFSHLLRCENLYTLLESEGYGNIPLYITEYGVPREDWNTTDKLQQLQAYDEQLSMLSYVAGAHVYVNPWDPPYSTYPAIYDGYKQYCIAVKDRANG